MSKKTKRNLRFILYMSIAGFTFLLSLTAVSYSFYQIIAEQEEPNIVGTQCFNLDFETGNTINLTNTFPVTDERGMRNIPSTFIITNLCDRTMAFELTLDIASNTNLPLDKVRVYLTDVNNIPVSGYESAAFLDRMENVFSVPAPAEGFRESFKLTSGTLSQSGEEAIFNLRLWLDENTTLEDLDMHGDNPLNRFEARVTLTSVMIDD